MSTTNTPTPATASQWVVTEHEDVIFIRRTSASVPKPEDWAERLSGMVRSMPGVAAVGAKRLDGQGRLFSMGEMLVHPKGFHHLGRGVVADAYRFPEEVDALAGGVCAVRAEALEELGIEPAVEGELGLLDLCLKLRRGGWRCAAVPQVVVEDAVSPEPGASEAEAFGRSWGFDWRAADLAAVRERHAGTGLLWNLRYHAEAMPFEKYAQRPAMHWQSYQQVDVYRQRADHLAKVVRQLTSTSGGRVLDLGCGDGLFVHLFARDGAEVVGVDPEGPAIEQAERQTRQQSYPGQPPRFHDGDGESLGWPDGSFDVITMLDVIEHLPNPVRVLREAERLLSSGGQLLISTPAWQYGGWSDAVYHVCEYSAEELTAQVQAVTGMQIGDVGMIKGAYRDLVVVARKS